MPTPPLRLPRSEGQRGHRRGKAMGELSSGPPLPEAATGGSSRKLLLAAWATVTVVVFGGLVPAGSGTGGLLEWVSGLTTLAGAEEIETSPESAVKALLQRQSKAWSRGDLEGFVSAYAPEVRFVSPSGITRGRDQVLERYRRRYPDAAAMGTLTLEVEEVRTAADERVAHVAAVWRLTYADREPAEGYTLLALRRTAEGNWEIIEDASM